MSCSKSAHDLEHHQGRDELPESAEVTMADNPEHAVKWMRGLGAARRRNVLCFSAGTL